MRYLWLMIIVVSIAACSSAPVNDGTDPSADGSNQAGNQNTGDNPQGQPLQGDGAIVADPLNEPGSLLSQRVLYFAYDSSQLDAKYHDILNAHAEYLLTNPGTVLRLEGHGDERGTREYNVALGERRAREVFRYLSFQGVAKDQMKIVSFGEELPVAFGHDESAWGQNRRVELVYEGV